MASYGSNAIQGVGAGASAGAAFRTLAERSLVVL